MGAKEKEGESLIRASIGSRTYEFESDLETYFRPFRDQIIGNGQSFESPYGKRRIIYADWTASGRLYAPIERKITEVFGPFMANTHTESNVTSSIMTCAYKQAQTIIKHHVHANQHDVIIMDGFGMTSAINKLQRILALRIPEKWKHQITLTEEDRPVIFLTHMEHHSNHTTWLESIGDVILLEPRNGQVDVQRLEERLQQFRHRKWKIGSFSACSNVTGIPSPYHQLAKKMHEHGGICFVDFAASAPYIDINMHPEDPMEKLDGIFFSPHKFLGGPGSSGVLVFDSRLYQNTVPDHPGGGTVTWTNPWGQHQYVTDIEIREDGGTPGILQGIRAALCVKLKEQMGVSNMMKREKELLHLLLPGLKDIQGVHVFEEKAVNRLGIVSFYVENLHYNLVVRLLNDRFGYQVRGGCSCAGTYGHFLFNLDPAQSKVITDKIDQGDLSLKPGWVRFSLHPTMTNAEIYGFIHAMRLITQYAEEWKKDYVYDPTSNDYFYVHHSRADMDALFQMT
jgi:selenocysteine lyase/cysteine desulfurase